MGGKGERIHESKPPPRPSRPSPARAHLEGVMRPALPCDEVRKDSDEGEDHGEQAKDEDEPRRAVLLRRGEGERERGREARGWGRAAEPRACAPPSPP